MITQIKSSGQLNGTGDSGVQNTASSAECASQKKQSQIVSISLLNFTKSHPL